MAKPTQATDLLSVGIKAAVLEALREFMPQQPTNAPRLYSAKEAAKYIGLSTREVYNMIANGELPAVRHGKRTMLDKRDLDSWIDRHKTAA
jgi:excisionase family DNA binding protein